MCGWCRARRCRSGTSQHRPHQRVPARRLAETLDGRALHRFDAWLVVLGSTSLFAWAVLGLYGATWRCRLLLRRNALAVRCRSRSTLRSCSTPAKLAAGSALMIAAMMSPLLMAPLRHVRDRSFARRRARAMLLFVAGYARHGWPQASGCRPWRSPCDRLCPHRGVPRHRGRHGAAVAGLARQAVCLNRCHRDRISRRSARRPTVTLFIRADARRVVCRGVLGADAAAAPAGAGSRFRNDCRHARRLCERLEGPAPLAWRWRGIGKALRIATAQVRMQLARGSASGRLRHEARNTVYEGVNLLDVAGPLEMFYWVGRKDLETVLVSSDGGAVTSLNGFVSRRRQASRRRRHSTSCGFLGEPRCARDDHEGPQFAVPAVSSPSRSRREMGLLVCEGALLLARAACSMARGDDALGFRRMPATLSCDQGGHDPPALRRVRQPADRRHLLGLDEALKLISLLFDDDRAKDVQVSTQYFPLPR